MSETSRVDELFDILQRTQQELEDELERLVEEKREHFKYKIHVGKVIFEKNIRKLQRQQRIGSLRYIFNAPVRTILTSPVIYGMVVPIGLLDIAISIYQHICFRVYKVPRVRRSDYVVIDRHRLAYLNSIQKFNCVYCGYGNGVIAYAREIIARTEQFWCPIKHAKRMRGPHQRLKKFLDYGDHESWEKKFKEIRNDW